MTDVTKRRNKGRGPVLGLLLLVSAVCAPFAPARAQADDCDALRQQLTSGGGDSTRGATFSRAAQRLRQEIARTQAYADQSGCNGGVFSIFSDRPAVCDAIDARLRRMTDNLQQLESQAEFYQAPDADRQAALTARYNAECAAADQQMANADPLRQGLDGFPDEQTNDGSSGAHYGKAICVRTCDGGYFPLGSVDGGSDLTKLGELCSALCPNTEAKLYTTPDTDDLKSAVAADGTDYTALPTAFKFQKSFDATCSCKPAGKTWVEALAQAEALIGKSGGNDVTVTQEISDQMARPTAAKPTGKSKAAARVESKAVTDAQAAAENALGSQAPTASRDSAGIASGAVNNRVIKTGEGPVKEEAGPDGAKRRVRIIEPLL